jgi:hypothetical protein
MDLSNRTQLDHILTDFGSSRLFTARSVRPGGERERERGRGRGREREREGERDRERERERQRETETERREG